MPHERPGRRRDISAAFRSSRTATLCTCSSWPFRPSVIPLPPESMLLTQGIKSSAAFLMLSGRAELLVGRRADRFGRAGGHAGRSRDDWRQSLSITARASEPLHGIPHRPRASSCGGQRVSRNSARPSLPRWPGSWMVRCRSVASLRPAFDQSRGPRPSVEPDSQRKRRHDRHVVGRLRSSRGLPSGSSISLQAGARPGVDQIWSSRRPRSRSLPVLRPVAPPGVELLVRPARAGA